MEDGGKELKYWGEGGGILGRERREEWRVGGGSLIKEGGTKEGKK